MMKASSFRGLLPILLFLCQAGLARADDDIPVLLRFAEEYQSNSFSGLKNTSSANTTVHNGKAQLRSDGFGDKPSRRELQQGMVAHKEKLARQQAILQKQRQQLESLNKALNQAQEQLQHFEKLEQSSKGENIEVYRINMEDFTPLMQLITRVRHALGGTPDEVRSAVLLKKVRAEKDQMMTALSRSQSQLYALKKRLAEQEMQAVKKHDEERDAHVKEISIIKTRLNSLLTIQDKNNTKMMNMEEERRHLQKEVKDLHQRAKYLISPEKLKKPVDRQTYAAGAALGRDIISLLDERKRWGVNADYQTILAGIIDTFTGQYRMTNEEMNTALIESEGIVTKARESVGVMQQKKGKEFITSFKKKKGSRQSPSGFWYQVGHVGDSPIDNNSVVDVVVKESLTDGTVIEDMDLSGKVLSQPLEAYPPLFREAIGYLRNHGSVTLVVPPELAYGEAGYPPKIPPHATMVYELRIEDVKKIVKK
ncbi:MULTISPECIES: FKBP-type peptidyl-prolyl cis-trans isomerase N-terminal domain-containing protein [Enterobacter cloacae complex]|uniref:FKBP-type peptidyl-prolyl cis-trans isomerase N-terminal domain-containing protein n=1 Tax=Enterobacter cloacae complex TaxID=354276 RepID=UPI003075EE58